MKIFFILGFLACCINLYSQENEEKITEAKIAFEKYSDCEGARLALSEVTLEGQSDLLFIYYSAQVHECLKKYNKAILYYEKFNSIKKDSSLYEKIIELKYLLRQKITNCEKCKGAVIYEKTEVCEGCEGSGEGVPEYQKGGGFIYYKCSSCKGKGKITKKIKCDHSDY